MPQTSQPAPFRSPAQFLAFGFGSGLAPVAPGTAGTAVAVPLCYLMGGLTLPLYSAVVIAAALVGIWICGAASRELQVHDHSGIVWDEFVGYWLTMWALPLTWPWLLAGFLLFRVIDVLKPWPVNVLDRKLGGGLGIMLDDILAGAIACAMLHAVRWLLQG